MYEAIYLIFLKNNSFSRYQQCWKTIAQYLINYRGAVESKIYFSSSKDYCLIHSRWPNEFLQKNNWPLPKTTPQQIKNASEEMNPLKDKVQQLHFDLKSLKKYILENKLELIEHLRTQRRQILLYNDEGCGSSVYEIFDQLKKTANLEHYRLKIVDAKYINEIDWETKTQLLIMPGGRARPYYISLGAKWETEKVDPGVVRKLKEFGIGNNRIRKFVENGGQYLGICAGAYYGAGLTVFERGSSLEVLDEGALKFFSGTAEGPAYGLGKFDYDSEAGSEIAIIRSSKIANCPNLSVYFNGGCYFHTEETETPSENILAHYTNIKGKHKEPIAIVENQCGSGAAILSGVHFEHSSLSLREKAKYLAKQDDERTLFFARIINRLRTVLNPTMYNQIYAQQVYPLKTLDVRANILDTVERKHFPEIDSTQVYSKQHSDELKPGKWLLVTADTQTNGIGTHGRDWKSSKEGLYATFSTIISSEYSHIQENLSQLTALSIIQILETFGLEPTLKWPNDILLDGKKVAGILCELSNNNDLTIHIGIGINANMTEEECSLISQPATSINIALSGKEVSKGQLLFLLQKALFSNVNHLMNFGPKELIKLINDKLAFKGESIYFDTGIKNNVSLQVIRCIVKNINHKGHLVLDLNGEEFTFLSGRILRDKELLKYQQQEDNMKRNTELSPGQFSIFANSEKEIKFFRKHFVEAIPSTQDYLRDNVDEMFATNNAVLVTAEEQIKGRGTHNRIWRSPPHVNIYATFGIILPGDPEKLKHIKEQPITTQIAVLSVTKTLEDFGLKPRIKWRNDVLVNGKKISGILCELIENMKSGQIAGMIGIGLNVNMSKEICAELDQPVTSMMSEANHEFNKEDVLERLQVHLAHYIKMYFGSGFAICQQEINERLAFIGKPVCVHITDSVDESKWEIIEGTFENVDNIGRLNLRLADGDLRVITKGRILKEAEFVPAALPQIA